MKKSSIIIFIAIAAALYLVLKMSGKSLTGPGGFFSNSPLGATTRPGQPGYTGYRYGIQGTGPIGTQANIATFTSSIAGFLAKLAPSLSSSPTPQDPSQTSTPPAPAGTPFGPSLAQLTGFETPGGLGGSTSGTLAGTLDTSTTDTFAQTLTDPTTISSPVIESPTPDYSYALGSVDPTTLVSVAPTLDPWGSGA